MTEYDPLAIGGFCVAEPRSGGPLAGLKVLDLTEHMAGRSAR